ncbi:hypothetical protein R6Q59_026999 [Mikania micrantha]
MADMIRDFEGKRRRKRKIKWNYCGVGGRKGKYKAEKDAMSNQMSKIEDMLKTLVRK